jgi:phosphoglycerol transferase MdoB-like AlkP superfamily enzyme
MTGVKAAPRTRRFATIRAMRAGGVRLLALVAAVGAAMWARDVCAVQPPLAWELIDQRTPAVVWANRLQTVRLTVRNAGSATWSEAAGDHISYHWLDQAGATVGEGVRTSFVAPVPPGGEVEIDARVLGPTTSGSWVLEWGMVREQVRWYGPPVSGEDVRLPVRVWWWSGLLQLLFGLATIALALLIRSRHPERGSWGWAPLSVTPVAWTAVAVALEVFTFAELVGKLPEQGGVSLVWSGAALVALLCVPFPVPLRAWAAAGVAAVVGFVTVADLVYLRYFGSVVPLAALAGIGQVGRVEGSVKALLSAPDAWLVAPAVGGLAAALLWPRRDARASSRAVSIGSAAATAIACLLAALPAMLSLRTALASPSVSTQVFSESMLVGRWGVMNVHLFDIARTVREWGQDTSLSKKEVARVTAQMRTRAAAIGPSPSFGVARGDNLILIQVESLQQWVIGAEVGGVEVTPFLNSLSRRALYFPYVFDDTEQGRSSDGEFTTLNSLYPLTQGAVAFRREDNHFVALPGVLKAHGYATLSAHPFERGFWNRAVLHPRYGFDRMMFRKELGPGEVIGWGLADGVFFARVAPALEKLPQPFFAMLITLGLHHPFDLFPDRHKVLDVGPLKDKPLGNYIHAMHYFDASLAALIAELERSGLLRNTVVALYGDHESGLGSGAAVREVAGAGRWTPSTNAMLWRIPLFVMVPGGELTGERPVPGSHVDIAPTLLDLLGVERPTSFIGSSLLGSRPFPALLRGGSAVADSLLFVVRGDRVPDGGSCFTFPGQAPRPRAACDDLARAALDQRRLSLAIVDHDLAETVASSR